jgi:signal transduction histidine kinase
MSDKEEDEREGKDYFHMSDKEKLEEVKKVLRNFEYGNEGFWQSLYDSVENAKRAKELEKALGEIYEIVKKRAGLALNV